LTAVVPVTVAQLQQISPRPWRIWEMLHELYVRVVLLPPKRS